MLCNDSTAPVVTNANITKWIDHDGKKLPDNTTVTYSCLPGYELENPNNNFARCVYELNDPTGSYVGNNHQFVTAIWRGQEKVHCVEGKF